MILLQQVQQSVCPHWLTLGRRLTVLQRRLHLGQSISDRIILLKKMVRYLKNKRIQSDHKYIQPAGVYQFELENSYLQLLFHNISQNMRSRSCALHSDSEEEFIQLAEATLDNSGIFYDEKINRKVMANIGNLSAAPQSSQAPPPTQTRKNQSEAKSLYLGFDFSSEFQVAREEKQQLERIPQFPQTTFNIGVVSSGPPAALARLSTLLRLPLWDWQPDRLVDLVVLRKDRIVYKIWVFDKDEVDKDNILLQSYLDKCKELIDIEEVEWSRRSIPTIREDLFSCARLLQ